MVPEDNVEDFPAGLLDELRDRGLLRTLCPAARVSSGWLSVGGTRLRDFSSNDYLGLSRHPALLRAACEAMEKWGSGAGASRLMSGDLELHHGLEAAVATLKGTEAALLFGSGYLANTGIIGSAFDRSDAVFADRFCHASMVDGIRLSRARFFRFRHNDLEHLEDLLRRYRSRCRKALIAVESLYSMEGDAAPLDALIWLRRRYGAMLLVDEAHATGLFGRGGEGLVERGHAEEVDFMVGTFGKALGSYGAFAAISGQMKRFLVNRARTFIFSTALPPSVAGASLAAVRLVHEEPDRRSRVHHLAAFLRAGLSRRIGLTIRSQSQIVPVNVGENRQTLRLQESLGRAGFFVRAVRPPTVPEGMSRIRLSVTAYHDEETLAQLVEALADGLHACR